MKKIKIWEELAKLPPSETHRIEIDLDFRCGWIMDIKTDKIVEYLSTHTFYESTYKISTKILQKCGFDVELESWG